MLLRVVDQMSKADRQLCVGKNAKILGMMSKYSIYLSVLLILACVAQLSGQNNSGNYHQFSGSSWNNDNSCVACHISRDQTEAGRFRMMYGSWDPANKVQSFEVYSQNDSFRHSSEPTGSTKLCLSCHDGQVASVSHFIGNPEEMMGMSMDKLTEYLSNNHPVSIVYDSRLAMVESGLNDPNITLSGLGGTIAEDLLENGRLECISCHDVHDLANRNMFSGNMENTMNNGFQHDASYTLRKSNQHSALCLTCHTI